MEYNSPERLIPFNLDLVFRRGLGRMLLLCFLGLAVVPVALVGFVSYQTAYHRLEREVHQNIRTTTELKSRQLRAFFDDRLSVAYRQGRERTTVSLFNSLVRKHAAAEGTVAEFIRSVPWSMAVSAYESDMELHASLHGYSDILLIDTAGNVLFSSARQKDLAENLNQADFAETLLAAAFRRTLDTGNTVLSGFEPYAPAGGTPTAFVTAAIHGDGVRPLGVIVFKIPSGTMDQMLGAPMEMGSGSQVYLLDSDLTVLAGNIEEQYLDKRATVDTSQTRLWQENLIDAKSELPPPIPFTYTGPGGNLVMGTHEKFRIGNTPYALIVEIETEAALSDIIRLRVIIIAMVILAGVGALMVSAALARTIVGPLRDLSNSTSMVAEGRLDHYIHVAANNEIGELAEAFGHMVHHLKAVKAKNDNESRSTSGMASLQRLISGEQELGELCLNTLEFLFGFLDLSQAGFFIVNSDGGLKCASQFPSHPDGEHQKVFYPGEGRVGQAVLGNTIAVYQKEAVSGLVTPAPTADLANQIVMPLMLRQTVKGAIELEKSGVFRQVDRRFVETAAEVITVAVNAAMTRQQEEALLEQTREQARKMKVREAALEANTQELQMQSRTFQASEEKLQLKQMELEAANAQMVKNAADLEAHMTILETQKLDMEKQNTELEKTHRELSEKAQQLELSSRYKTEFMANMSHELRTPLNSILLLSRLLLENKEKNLTKKQSEFARTIHSAGEDLLNLINEILDLAKVESGKMEAELATVRIQSIADAMQTSFSQLAEQSGVTLSSHVAPDVPERLITDRKRIEQIVKNFLSNAFKFTAMGSIRLEITVSRELIICRGADDEHETGCLAISVVDTGIGIPPAKQQMVFEAFQQVDGSTRRKYGGTGLGLSISRELARLLGGEITLESEDGQGSRFTLHLPMIPLPDNESAIVHSSLSGTTSIGTVEPPPTANGVDAASAPVPDDRKKLVPGDKCILIIDAYASTTEPIKDCAYQNGYKVLVAEQFQTGLHFSDYYLPAAIFVNLQLPGAGGWTMIQRLHANPRSRPTPIFTLSPQGDSFTAAVHGAAGHIIEPVTAHHLKAAFNRIDELRSADSRTVLVVAPNPDCTTLITDAVDGRGIRIKTAANAAEAKVVLKANNVHAMVLHSAVPENERHSFLNSLRRDPTPVFLCYGVSLSTLSQAAVSQYENVVNLKVIDTPDHLLLALVSSLHLPTEALDAAHQDRLRTMDSRRAGIKGRKVLLVDDDMRTVFAVSSVLEDHGAEVLTGKTGKESLDKLNGFPDIDLILMDVMISEVDGYQSIRKIRNQDRFRTIPILALTAKAMKGDRAKCIEAGADDYLAKPVNLDKLMSMLNIWLGPPLAASEPIDA